MARTWCWCPTAARTTTTTTRPRTGSWCRATRRRWRPRRSRRPRRRLRKTSRVGAPGATTTPTWCKSCGRNSGSDPDFLALGFQEHQQCAAAAIARGGLAVGEHLFALRQPAIELSLQDAEALAVHDAHAADTTRQAMIEKFDDHRRCLVAGEAVQVDAVLDRPVAAAEFAQRLAGHAFAQVAEFLTSFQRLVGRQRAGQALGQRRGL